MPDARLVDLAVGWARRDGARDLIVDGPARVSYADFARQAEALAAALTRAGLQPDARWQEVGWALVLAKGEIAEAELDAHARQSLANFKVPKRFVVRHELPLLPIGKIDKRALKRAALDGAYG